MDTRTHGRAVVVTGVTEEPRLAGVVALAERAGVPVTLALDAESAVGLVRAHPDWRERLRAAFAAGRVRPALTTAHGCDARLLGADELADELRLDEEMLQALFGVTAERRGFAGEGEAATLEQAGIDFVVGGVEAPVRVGERLMALPGVTFDLDELSIEDVAAAIGQMGDVVAAEALAAELTPPWLPPGEAAVAEPPAVLRALADLTGWCVDAFGLRRVPGVAAAGLIDEGWRLERFPARARLPLVRRRGLCARRRAFVAAYELCDVLSVEARVPGLAAHATAPLGAMVLPTLRTLAEGHGAADPLVRAEAAYEELRAFRFLGAQRWRALLTSLRDAFALLAARRQVDWDVRVEERAAEPSPVLRLVEPTVPLN